MLDDCAPGYTFKETAHNFFVMYNGRTYPSLPKGGHGKKSPEIEIGHVRQMGRHLQIDRDCERRYVQL